eukprot:scaffold35396_cov14-Tisochrysis_lutea.AAC.1
MPHLLQPAGQELEFIALFREVHVAPRLYMPWPRDFRVFRAKILRFLKLIAHCSTCSCCHVPFPTASWTDRVLSLLTFHPQPPHLPSRTPFKRARQRD